MRTPLLIATVLLSGCATSHYGRELPVIPAERIAYDCAAIGLEIAKCDAFMNGVFQQWRDTEWRRAGGWLMDFGIGDHRERGDALESARVRRTALVDLGRAKDCPLPPPLPTE